MIILRWCCLNIPMLFILNRLLGMYGLVWAQVVSDLITVAVSYVLLARYMKANMPITEEKLQQ